MTTTAPTAPPSDVQPGGTITYVSASDINTLDPVAEIASAPDTQFDFAIFDALIYEDATNSSIASQVAESLTSSDAVVWTLKLRQNVRFSDGTLYDAAAVKFQWDRIADPSNTSPNATAVRNIAATDVIDQTTLRVTLKGKDSQFPRSVVNISFIPSPTAVKAQGKDFGSNPVGAGPFILKSWTRQSQMVMTRNPGYWNNPLPYADQLIIKYIAEDQQRVDTYKSGGGNLFYTNVPELAAQVTQAGGHGMTLALSGGPNIYFNLEKAPANDLRFRQALYAGINLAQMTKTLHGDLIPPLDSVFAPNSPIYDKNQLQPGYDPVKAQQLFDAIYASNGNKDITFPLTVLNQSLYVNQAQFIQAALNQFNHVKVTLDIQSVQTEIANVNQRNYQVAIFSSSFNDPDPKWVNTFISTASPSPTAWKNSAFDAAIADAKATLDPNKRVADFREALRQFYNDMPALFIEHGYKYALGSPALQNITLTGQDVLMYDRMWIKTR